MTVFLPIPGPAQGLFVRLGLWFDEIDGVICPHTSVSVCKVAGKRRFSDFRWRVERLLRADPPLLDTFALPGLREAGI